MEELESCARRMHLISVLPDSKCSPAPSPLQLNILRRTATTCLLEEEEAEQSISLSSVLPNVAEMISPKDRGKGRRI